MYVINYCVNHLNIQIIKKTKDIKNKYIYNIIEIKKKRKERERCVWSVGFEPPLKAKEMLEFLQTGSLSIEQSDPC